VIAPSSSPWCDTAKAEKRLRDYVLAGLQQQVKEKLDSESTALYATARLWDDGIIDPRETRKVLALALATSRDAARRKLRASSFGVARM